MDLFRTWDSGIGKDIEKGKVGFEQLEAHVLKHGEPKLESGRHRVIQRQQAADLPRFKLFTSFARP